jgi:hypothetical protein
MDADKQAWLAKYATGSSHDNTYSTPVAQTMDQIRAILRDQFGILLKRRTIDYTKPYPSDYDLIPLPPKYRLHEFTKEAVELASLGLAKPIKDMGFQLEFNSLAHLVQKLTSNEKRHPDIYQDKFKHQITLVDTEDAEDSGEEQEVAVVEWTQGASPLSCKWVKHQGPTKGFDFDESKVEQIFNLLLREKQLNLPEGHKFPTAQELQGRPYCKWHHLFTHNTNECKELHRQIQSAIE